MIYVYLLRDITYRVIGALTYKLTGADRERWWFVQVPAVFYSIPSPSLSDIEDAAGTFKKGKRERDNG